MTQFPRLPTLAELIGDAAKIKMKRVRKQKDRPPGYPTSVEAVFGK
jgi:hypothetical protein